MSKQPSHALNLSMPPVDRLTIAKETLRADPERARRLASAVVELEPNNADALHVLGEACARLGRFGQAAELLRRSLASEGGFAGGGISWIGRFTEAACAGCGSGDADPVWVGDIADQVSTHGLLDPVRVWVRCRRCGLHRVDAPPPRRVLDAWRAEDAVEHGADGPPDEATLHRGLSRYDRWIERIRSQGYGTRWTSRRGEGVPKPRLLEVGSGFGLQLAAAEWRGFSAVGLSRDPNQIRWARQSLGLDVRPLQDVLPDGPFDVIVHTDPIEDEEAPVARLAALAERLEPDGLLSLSTPMLDHPIHRLRGYDDAGWCRASRRVWFDRQSLSLALIRAGLQPEGSWHDEDSAGLVRTFARKVGTR